MREEGKGGRDCREDKDYNKSEEHLTAQWHGSPFQKSADVLKGVQKSFNVCAGQREGTFS